MKKDYYASLYVVINTFLSAKKIQSNKNKGSL